MVGLSTALSNALSGLFVSSSQTALVSRNITRAGDTEYNRRDVGLTIAGDGTARIGEYTRSTDKNLQDRVLRTSSQLGTAQISYDALSRLSQTVGDPADGTSLASGLFTLQQSLRGAQNNPSNFVYASQAISDAKVLSQRLNVSAETISSVRNEAHFGVKTSIEKINSLLSALQPLERVIVSGPAGTENHLEHLDQRDSIVKQLSEEIGLRVVYKSDGGMALHTESGITLFDKVPRLLEVRNDGPLSPGIIGPVVVIDGVPVSGSGAVMSLTTGRLATQLQVRDDLALSYEKQVDEIARSLITQFSEQDQSIPSTLPARTGLFAYNGSPVVPPGGVISAGLAGQIRISQLFDPSSGGNPTLVRDGGANGASYISNTTGDSGFQNRLTELVDGLDSPFAFNVGGSAASTKAFATSLASKLAAEFAGASATLDEAKATNQRWVETSQNKSGVNLDEEMAALLSLEKSYQASAKVMTTVDQMFAVLVGIVR